MGSFLAGVAAESAFHIEETMMVSIIIVTYNSERFIRECIRSIEENVRGCEYEIIVSDNSSKDRTAAIVYKEFRSVRLIRNRRNIGFAASNNKAVERARGDYLFFLNPDTVMINDAAAELKKFLDENPDAGCAGAKLEYYDGSHQYSCRQFPNYLNVFFGRRSVFRTIFPENPISRNYMLESLDYTKVQKVDWVMGAAFMCRKSQFEEVGLFDEQFFLFVEDTELCYRMKCRGLNIYYVPQAKIKHYHGGSGKRGFNLSHLHHNLGMYKFFKKHKIKNEFMRFALYCSIVIRLFFVFIEEELLYIYGNITSKRM